MMDDQEEHRSKESEGSSAAEDAAYEAALDLTGMPGLGSALIAHLLSESEEDAQAAPPEDPVLAQERALAVQKSQESARPRPPSLVPSGPGH